MSDLTLIDSNQIEYAVIQGDILFPYIGNWSAHLIITSGDNIPSGSCTLQCFDEEFTGYIIQSGSFEKQIFAMVVGGSGGLSTTVSATGYNYQVKTGLVLQEMLSSIGEKVSTTSSQDALNMLLPSWNRLSGSCSLEVSRLIDQAGGIWRVVADGGIYVGTDSFSIADEFEYTVICEDPIYSYVKLSINSLSLLPGQRFPSSGDDSIAERKIGACRYQFMSDNSMMTAWFLEEQAIFADPLHAGLELFVKEVMRGVDYLASYPCKIVQQRSDGTLDIIPDSPRVPPMTSVPLVVDQPSLKLKIPANSRAKLFFDESNPQKFYVTEFDMGAGGRKISGVGDEVKCGSMTITTVANGVFTGSYTDGNGTTTTIALGTPIPIAGKITKGNPNFEFGMESS